MSLFTRALAAIRGNPLNNPAVPLSSGAPWLTDLFGGGPTAAGVAVNEMTAMQLATVYTCVNGIASDISSLTLKTYEDTPTGRRPAIDADLYQLLAVQPNPEMTPATFFSTWVGCAVLTGNGYAEIQRDGSKAVALWPRNPRHVRPRRAKASERLASGGTAQAGDLVYEVNDAGESRLVAAANMLHLPGLSMDGWIGLSPIQAARQTIGTAIAAEKFGAGFFGRGSRPSGLLTGPMDERDPVKRQQAKDSWEAANSGENQGRTAVMPGGWTWTKIGISPSEAQFLETQQYTRTQIAALFRYPAHMAGDSGRLSNGNHESIALEYVKFTLRPWLVRIQQEIHRKLVPTIGRSAGRFSVAFDLSELERADFAAQMTAFATGKQWSFLTTNDIRMALGKNPVPGGDVLYVPLNMVPLGSDGMPVQVDVDDAAGDAQGDGNDGNQEAEPAGNGGQNQRMLLARMARAYERLFRDAHGRLVRRSKRDLDAVTQIFGPVLDTIAAEAERQARSTFRLPAEADLGTEKVLRDCRKAIEKRSADWTAATAEADALAELHRTVRAITLGIFREAGTSVAIAA